MRQCAPNARTAAVFARIGLAITSVSVHPVKPVFVSRVSCLSIPPRWFLIALTYAHSGTVKASFQGLAFST
uniref:Secreted protein n=1 Tax=Mesocestoides corti TaxID=53468 RepID=A0A5K3FPB3_MESCO